MRITRVVARDFEAYEDLDLDLAGISSVVIVGKNNHGKSAILDTITWCLYDEIKRDISSKDLLIRDGADSAYAAVEFEAGGREIRVEREKQRGRTGTLGLTVDGSPDTRHTIAETKAAIEALIGLSFDALMAGPVMAQETAAAFMKARPADRKDLLVRLFGLERYETYWRAATDRQRAAQGKATGLEAAAATARARIEGEAVVQSTLAYEQEKLAVFTEAQSLANARIGAAREQIAAATVRAERYESLTRRRADLNAAIAGNERTRAALGARLAEATVLVDRPLPPADADAIREADDALDEARTASGSKDRILADLKVAQAAWANLQAAHAKLADVPCHGEGIYATCAFLTGAPTQQALAEAQAHVATLTEKARGVSVGDIGGLRDRVQALRAQLERRRTEEVGQARAVATLDEGRANMGSLRDSSVAMTADLERVVAELQTVEEAGRSLIALNEELMGATSTYEQARRMGQVHDANVRKAEAELAAIATAKEDLAGLLKQQADLESLAGALGLLAKAFHRDGIPTRILMGGIPLIEAEANRVLATLPGDLSIALRTERAKATGGMAETLDVVVTVNGWEREYGLISVGARFRVDLALRLGLARVLTHRSGASIETLWLDEPLAALDAEGREAVMETLGQLEQDFGLIVVVSHDETFNERMGARIDVTQTDGVSTARLAA